VCAPSLSLALTTVVWLAGHPQPLERGEAERLARIGRHAEALAAFQRIVARDPADVESRVWIGRLQLWMGRAGEAESTFRAVLLEHPRDVDARIGLGAALTRSNRTDEAIAVLEATRADAGENADFFAALARAHRHAGRPRAARDLFVQAHRLAPDDRDILDGLEAVRRTYDHFVSLEGYTETIPDDGGNAADGTLTLSLRASERLRLDGAARLQSRSGGTDSLFGGGAQWRAGRGTILSASARGGPGNQSLPVLSVSTELTQYSGSWELGGGVRLLHFETTDVTALSATAAWDTGGRWRLDARYTYSRSSFEPSGRMAGDHSVLLRGLRRQWRRVWLAGSYAHGAESFDVLTADRVGSFDADTVSAGVRILTPSLLTLHSTWEHQWRSDGQTIDRFTCAVVRHF
jgi:YaiO family outer membrane protein